MGSEIKPDAENPAFQSNKPTQHFQSNGGIQSILKKIASKYQRNFKIGRAHV